MPNQSMVTFYEEKKKRTLLHLDFVLRRVTMIQSGTFSTRKLKASHDWASFRACKWSLISVGTRIGRGTSDRPSDHMYDVDWVWSQFQLHFGWPRPWKKIQSIMRAWAIKMGRAKREPSTLLSHPQRVLSKMAKIFSTQLSRKSFFLFESGVGWIRCSSSCVSLWPKSKLFLSSLYLYWSSVLKIVGKIRSEKSSWAFRGLYRDGNFFAPFWDFQNYLSVWGRLGLASVKQT